MSAIDRHDRAHAARIAAIKRIVLISAKERRVQLTAEWERLVFHEDPPEINWETTCPNE